MRHDVVSNDVFAEGVKISLVKLDNAQFVGVGLRFLLDHTVEDMLPPDKGYSHLKGNPREDKVDTG